MKLYNYLRDQHWSDQGLIGPDVGIRINFRVGRFIKSYLGQKRWHDNYYYLQTQGYWILVNWCLSSLTGEAAYRDIALQCSRQVIRRQRADGGWDYPNPEWKGRVANSEGTWASFGLLRTYAERCDAACLEAVLRWYRFLEEKIGFQISGDGLAVNYFAGRSGKRVPNNSIFLMRLLAELAVATDDSRYLDRCRGLLAFLKSVQVDSGEFPYAIVTGWSLRRRRHFQCYQYNAFEALDLMRYYELTRDRTCAALISPLLRYLSTGVAADGHVHYDCTNRSTVVIYHAAAVAAALRVGSQLGFAGYDHLAERAFSFVAAAQKPDGGFPYSTSEHHILSDRRSYPRSLVMILYHLLLNIQAAARITGTVASASTKRFTA